MKLNLSFAEAMKSAGIPLVKIIVNGHEGYFLVDTGASVCNIDAAFAKEIRADEIASIVDVTTSLLGNSQVPRSYNVTFIVDSIQINDVACAEADFSTINESWVEFGVKMHGIIGMDIMSLFNGVIDMGSMTLTLNLPDAELQRINQQ